MQSVQTDEPTDVKITRCFDPHQISRILNEHYADEPLKSFTKNAKATFTRSWCAENPKVFFLLAEVDGKEAGFLLGHALGSRVWRRFAKEHLHHFASIMWVLLTNRLKRNTGHRKKHSNYSQSENILKVPDVDMPFPWSTEWGKGAIVEFFTVYPQYRGKAIAPKLLNKFADEISNCGQHYCEAHISVNNSASIKAFMKAGWSVYKTTTGDIWATFPDQVIKKNNDDV